MAASRMLRGEEERGALDVLLSLPRPRLRVALEKLGKDIAAALPKAKDPVTKAHLADSARVIDGILSDKGK